MVALDKLHLEPVHRELFDFQEADVEELLAADGRGFVVADPGAGKTLEAVETGLRSRHEVILVVAPANTLAHVWIQTIIAQDPKANVRWIDGSEDGKRALYEAELGYPGWYVMSTSIFARTELRSIRPDMTIIDEAHQVSSHDSKSFTRNLKPRQQGFHPGAPMVLSGTIYRNAFENFWSLLRFVYPWMDGPGELADINRERWIQANCETEYDHFRPGNYRVVGELIPGSLASRIPTYIQHFKRQECCAFHPQGFLHDLPAPIEIRYDVPMSAEQKKAMERMKDSYVAWLDSQISERKPLVAKLPISARTRMRQIGLGVPSFLDTGRIDDKGMPIETVGFAPGCESPKLDLFHQRFKAIGEPYLAMTTSKQFAHEAVRRFNEDYKIPATEWSGDIDKHKRDRSKEAFIAGDLGLIVGVVEAVATGIDGLQLATNNLAHFDRSEDTTSEIQGISRLDRRGQIRAVVDEDYVAPGTLDEGVLDRTLARKEKIIASLKRQLARERRTN